MDPQKQQKKENQQKQELKKQKQPKQQATEQDKKDPETLSQGQRMGLSKQQLRKLAKKIETKKKKQKKEEKKQEGKDEQKKQGEKKETNPKKGKPKKQVEIPIAHLKQFSSQKITIDTNTQLPNPSLQNILITSALPYVNNVPHLGNIIGCVLSADVYSRYKKLQGSNVLYISGTDQYGTATEVKAMEQKIQPQEVCDKYHVIHADIYRWFDINFDYFGRTTTKWHQKIVQEIFLDLHNNKLTLQEEQIQCYCEKCDKWLADRLIFGICPFCEYEDARGDQCDKCQKLINDPLDLKQYFCKMCKSVPVPRNTTHFFINLPQIQPDLEKWIDKASQQGKWSANSTTITKSWTNMGLKPKCITRDLKWGVPVPFEEFGKKVFYVWFDAPIGYLSISANLLQESYKSWWQNQQNVKLYQFMGKDNVPFHTVIFPSSLIGSKQPWTMLHHVSTTQYLNYEGTKFSKTRGTGIFGNHAIELQNQIPAEVWRYYLLVNRPEKSDSEFYWNDFVQKNNNELLANLGNLCHRALQFIYNNMNKKIPKIKQENWKECDDIFIEEVQEKYQKYKKELDGVQIKQGLKTAMEISSRGNKYLQDSAFWEKENRESGRTQTVLNVTANFLRFISFLVQPYMPSSSAKINFLLGLKPTKDDQIFGKIVNQNPFKKVFLGLTHESQQILQPVPLFKQYTKEQTQAWRQRFKGTA